MKKTLLFLVVAICSASILKADIVTQTDAALAAKNHYINYAPGIHNGSVELNLVYSKFAGNEPLYYIYNAASGKGFVIVSAEDNVFPVLGYAYEGSYSSDPGFEAENFNAWMENCSDQIVFARENDLTADSKIESAWSNLLSAIPHPKEFDNVDPLLSTLWDQGTYYNQLCPADPGGPGGHVWAGCVATAMAQVMKYHNFPEQGTGSHTYYCTGYGTQSADFGATTYTWASMPNQVNSSNMAVATLLYHLGVSVDMQYSASGSGAYSSDARDALVNYFSYSPNAVLLPKNSFPIETFVYKLKNELNLNRPVYYSGSGSGGGHAFVCDGYQGNDYFHFNWGWSGYANGYFYVSNLNPGGYQFNQGQAAMLYVYPEGSTVLAGPENLVAEVTGSDVNLSWEAPSGKALTGYNVYRNNTLLTFTTETAFSDPGLPMGSYTYYICALYDEGESMPSELVSVFTGGGTQTIFSDDFEAYTAGNKVACQNTTDWTTWSNAPCGTEDAEVTSAVTYSGSKAVIVQGVNDLVKVIPDYATGLYKISFQIYVPTGFLGYFNTLQDFAGANSYWGMQVYFNTNGSGSVDGGGEGAGTFSFAHDIWILNEVIVDMDNDWAEYKLGGESVLGWQWSTGAFGDGSLNQLGGVNFYAWNNSGAGTPKYYFDEFMIEEFLAPALMPPLNFTLNVAFENIQLTWDSPEGKELLGYNIYYAFNGGVFSLLDNTTETSYIVESPGSGLHAYYLTAVYDEGESAPTNIQEILLTGMDDHSDQASVSIFPNPAGQVVYIDAGEAISSVRLYNFDGQELNCRMTISGHTATADLSGMKNGVYFILITTKDQSEYRQVIKN